jgi:hypothetical protein
MASSPATEAPSGGFGDNLPDDQSCELLGPTALVNVHSHPHDSILTFTFDFSQVVQGVLGVLVILSLVYKRHRETPMRPWRIWSVNCVFRV